MKDSTYITLGLIIAIVVMYICALSQGINGALFTIATNAIIFIGTGKIIYDQKRKT